jgi:hypothetical protein
LERQPRSNHRTKEKPGKPQDHYQGCAYGRSQVRLKWLQRQRLDKDRYEQKLCHNHRIQKSRRRFKTARGFYTRCAEAHCGTNH